jgi:hypothetical protein
MTPATPAFELRDGAHGRWTLLAGGELGATF